MAHWYPGPQQMLPQQQQFGQNADTAYGPLPHPVCLAPPPYPPPYTYGNVSMGPNAIHHVWVPVKVASGPAPYPYCYAQVQPHPNLNFQPPMPYREARRPASASGFHEHDPLQMAWPDSPLSAHPPNLTQHRGDEWGPPRQQLSRQCPPTNGQCPSHSRQCPSHSTVTPPQTPAPADSCQCSQQAHHALNKQLAQLAAQDDTSSSHSTGFAGRSDRSVSSCNPGSSGAADSADITAAVVAVADAADSDDHVADGSAPAWQWLTVGLLRDVMSELPQHCRKRCRLICKRWRAILDLSVEVKSLQSVD